MFPYKTSFELDRTASTPLFLQLTNQFIQHIKTGRLPTGQRLIGSRKLAALLEVHRKTIVACYEELTNQGWTVSLAKKGTFVNHELPIIQSRQLAPDEPKQVVKPIQYKTRSYLAEIHEPLPIGYMSLNDGVSDSRLAPTTEVARYYRRISNRKHIADQLNYGTTMGSSYLRQTLVDYLNETRGLNIGLNNIMITRGSQMGIMLSSQLFLEKGKSIIIGETTYGSAIATFRLLDATIHTVSVDKEGLDTHEIEKICAQHDISSIYVTSHHHHPTTVTMSAQRRVHLLNIARKYGVAIIEDDYDYDFNYDHAPLLPLASLDNQKYVLYIGSICKAVAPAYRVGYLIGPVEVIREAARLRRYLDRQGDAILEMAFAEFIKLGDLDRHLRKVMKVYKARRDYFCELLQNELGAYLHFDIPVGGMAIWATLRSDLCWTEISKAAQKEKLVIQVPSYYDPFNTGHNGMRIGFAAYDQDEALEVVKRLSASIKWVLDE